MLLVLNIIANLVAFLAFIAFLNGVISWFCGLLGRSDINFEVYYFYLLQVCVINYTIILSLLGKLQYIMGKIFIPIAWLMGVPAAECDLVANLVALKTIVNEFAAYSKLSEYIAQGIISVIICQKCLLLVNV